MMKKNYYLICVLLLVIFCTNSVATCSKLLWGFSCESKP